MSSTRPPAPAWRHRLYQAFRVVSALVLLSAAVVLTRWGAAPAAPTPDVGGLTLDAPSTDALLSVVFAAITLARPNQFIPPTLRRQTDRFAAATYAVRAIPLGLAAAVVVWAAPVGIATALLLGVACAAQIGDLVLGAVHRVWGMAGGAGSGVVFHAVGVAAALGVVG